MKKNLVKFAILFIVFLIGFVADVTTKRLAFERLKNADTFVVFDGFMEFSYTENRGMVFGMLNDHDFSLKRYGLTIMTIISMVFIIYFTWKIRRMGFFFHLPLFMILAGALGNLIDRLRFGHVIDFIHIHWRDKVDWPFLFNVADAFIVTGLCLLFLLMLFRGNEIEEHFPRLKKATKETAADNNDNPRS